MNEHRWFDQMAPLDTNADRPQLAPLRQWVHRLRYFLLLVVVPTALTAAYYYLIAADQYESEAHFIVSANDTSSASAAGVGSLLGLTGASQSQSQMMSVPDYLESHDAVSALGRQVDIISMFRRPEADPLSKLSPAHPTPENLLKYYESMVSVHYDRDTGISTLKVRSFRPSDSYTIIRQLLQLSEQQVNRMNQRSYRDGVAMAQSQLVDAENSVADIQRRITAYRQSRGDIDPETSGQTQIRLVSDLNVQLAAARAQLATMAAMVSRTSPQYIALAQQVRSLEAEISRQSGSLTGGSSTIAATLGGYEDLRVRQQFAAKQYDAAAASLDKARQEAQRQQMYLVRVVDANMPVKALYPQRGKIVAITLIALCLAYGIGWLILAGVKEHAA